MSKSPRRKTTSRSATRTTLNRRSALSGIAASATVPYLFTASTATADDNASTNKNSRVTVASIGTSIYRDRYTGAGNHPGRGAVVGHQAGQLGDMVAVADVNTEHSAFFAERYGDACKQYQNYEDLLARDDIDAVTIGTPDHWHVKIAIDALRAGKHVYCEKPLTLTIDEGIQLCKVAAQSDRVFQVGTQQRSEFDSIFLYAIAIAQSGMLGDKLDCLISVGPGESGGPFDNAAPPETLDWDRWLGQTPKVPYCPQRCDFDYRWWLEYSGGQVTDWGAHHGDIALLAMGLGESGPTKIEGTGTFPDIENGFNVATQFDVNYEFPGGHTARLVSGKNELIIGGDRGRIRVNRGGLTGRPAEELGVSHKIGSNEWGTGESPADQKGPNPPDWLADAVEKLYHGKPRRGHMQNFFDCIEDGGTPISDVVSSHRSASLCHLANIAMKCGRPLTWDPAAEKFPDDDQAQSMVAREQREPYAIS